MTEDISRSTRTNGLAEFARDDSFGSEASYDPLVRVDEAVRLALAIATLEDPGVERGVTSAGTGNEVPSVDPVRERSGVAGGLVVDAPPRPPPLTAVIAFHALQEWEGYVLEVKEDEFVAALVDLTAGSSHEEEEAVIPLTELSEDDAARLLPGTIFRWVIGYERLHSGTKKRVSQIVIRDLPRITERNLQQGREWARETRRAFKL